jgi:hypothetical protein
MLWMAVEADVLSVDLQNGAKHQLCVPAVETGNGSWRFKNRA